MPVYSTLTGITRFQSGIGDNEDLQVKVREDLEGGWFPVVHRGFFYLGTTEDYLYSLPASGAVSVSTSGSTGTHTSAAISFDPTLYGPIQLLKPDGTSCLRVASPLRAFRSLSFSTVSGSLKSAAVSGLLISLVSDATSGILHSVPTSGDINGTDEYYYDQDAGLVYIRNTSPPSLFATYLVGEEEEDFLKQEEIHEVGLDGLIRVQYTNVSDITALKPVIRKPMASGAVSVVASAVSGNTITPSGAITSGDLVAVEYYVTNSFTARYTGTALTLAYLVSPSGTYSLKWEGEKGDWYDPSLNTSDPNRLQLNPLLTPRESGFLYLIDSSEAYPLTRKVRVGVSNVNPLLNEAAVRIVTTIYDGEGFPVPGVTVTTATSGVSGTLTAVTSGGISDARGQVIHTFTPSTTGTTTVTSTVTVAGTPYTDSAEFTTRNYLEYYTTGDEELGKLLLCLEETPKRDNLHQINVYYCLADGAPVQVTGTGIGAEAATGFQVTLSATKSTFYALDGRPLASTVTINTNEDGVASCLVLPVPGDTLRAVLTPDPTAVAVDGVVRKRVAAPIRIPGGEDGQPT
jgi:hypothetical protein